MWYLNDLIIFNGICNGQWVSEYGTFSKNPFLADDAMKNTNFPKFMNSEIEALRRASLQSPYCSIH